MTTEQRARCSRGKRAPLFSTHRYPPRTGVRPLLHLYLPIVLPEQGTTTSSLQPRASRALDAAGSRKSVAGERHYHRKRAWSACGFCPIPLYPLPRRLEGVHDLGLPAALLRVEVVLPPRRLREGHEDRLDAATGLEAEHRPSVVDQVELDVPVVEDETFPSL